MLLLWQQSLYAAIQMAVNAITGTQQGKLLAGDAAAGDFFGFTVSLSGDGNTAIVGAHADDVNGADSGSAYIFVRSGSSWTQQAKLTPPDPAAGYFFGQGVSISADGNTVLIGAYGDSDGGTNTGSAYIFTRSGITWAYQAKLMAADRAAGDIFGRSVSISGDSNTVLIGAHGDDDKGSNSGSAYIFVRSGSTWTQQAKLVAGDGAASDFFGYGGSLSTDGNTALVGGYGNDDGGSNSGSAYIFTRSGSTWTQQNKLLATDRTADDFFGFGLSISGDGNTALVGAYGDDDNGTGSGSAYIFTRSGSIWTQQAKLLAADAAAGDTFGYGVSLSADGNSALVGAYGADDNGANTGCAYIFTFDGGSWTQQAKLLAGDATAGDFFGRSVSISSDGLTALVGAYGNDDNGTDSGSAYPFV